MTVRDIVLASISEWPKASQDESRVIVPTHCLYPSNGVVSVVVEGGADTFRVHDDGAALEELDSAGGTVAIMRLATRRLGVEVSDAGVIFAPLAKRKDLLGSIVIVANASKHAATVLLWETQQRVVVLDLAGLVADMAQLGRSVSTHGDRAQRLLDEIKDNFGPPA